MPVCQPTDRHFIEFLVKKTIMIYENPKIENLYQ